MFARLFPQRRAGLSSCGDDSMSVNVKCGNGPPRLLEISNTSTVSDLREKIIQEYGEDVESIEIIFAGRILNKEEKIQDLHLGQESVLHALKVQKKVEQSATTSGRAHQYFVYCRECKSLRPGKLRVQCCFCQDKSFILDKEPHSLEDVLENRNISGHCNNTHCVGEQGEFFFKCGGHDGREERAVLLLHVRPNIHHIECITCEDVVSPLLVFPCASKHVMCIDCFKTYGLMRLNDRMFKFNPDLGYTLPCPAECDNSYIKETHHFCLLGDTQYERYKMFGTEENVLREGGVLCPGLNCGNGLIPPAGERKINCEEDTGGCGMVFCRNCLSEYHEGDCVSKPSIEASSAAYSIDPEREQKARWDDEARNLIEKISKPCPNCKTKTERDGGCMHMTCSRCSHQWCWTCHTEWNLDCQGDHWFG